MQSRILILLVGCLQLTMTCYAQVMTPGNVTAGNSQQQGQETATHKMVSGIITDAKGVPLGGATVVVKGTKQGTTSGPAGNFELQVPEGNVTLVISFVGYVPKELKVWKGNKVIALQPAVVEIKNVTVSTGMFNRNKTTYSGATSSFTGKELRSVGNLNVLQSLKTLDPSFIIVTNNAAGSNPNQLPKIELRGKTSLSTNDIRNRSSTDPNQPLFILNGMETTLQQIVDLDMNRVASITLLKDAASTALYGARAANGVVIVETIRPKPGELSVSYTTDLRFEAPVLQDYNMMNAAENLEFQQKAGLYKQYGSASPLDNDRLYNERLAVVTSGLNSYWLNTPLQNSFSNGHSLQVSGGNAEFQYGVGLNYRGLNGVMIGSDKKTWGGTVDLVYRKNKLNISNRLYVNGTNANESPYGSFSDFVNINPYYAKKKEDGSLNADRYLEVISLSESDSTKAPLKVGNPLYNARLGSKNNSNALVLQNNINLIYDINPEWQFSAGLQISKNVTTNINFVPSANTMFDNMDVYKKGSYREEHLNGLDYQGNVMLSYRKVINGKHSLTGNIRSEMMEKGLVSSAYTATGFPEGVKPNPAFAYGFVEASKPEFYKTKVRNVNALGSFNYAYDNRYFFDANYRIDGSTAFGTDNKFSPFWAVGAGWNINKEKMMEGISWLTTLRIRANIGVTGNQQLGSYASTSVYGFQNNLNVFGQGLHLNTLGNPLLEWQRTRSTSGGIDAVLWNGRLTTTFNIYEKFSNPMIADGSLPASSGVTSYMLNVGALRNRGVEAIVRFSPVFHPEKNVIWTLGYTGSLYKSRYEGFSNILKNLNDEAQRSKSLQRYLDGSSPDEIWAVTSLGIDPASGLEVFRKGNGEKTLDYNPADAQPQGENRPKIEGVVSSNLSIKGFLLGVSLRYSIGANILNTALYNRVENINFSGLVNNQDKRALELRWQHPGDVAEFKGISFTDQTPISSRFIQQENFLSGESINVGYEFHAADLRWLDRLGLKTIRLNGYMNDIFRLSNIKSERGINYPFSKTVAFSANVFF